LSRVVIVDSHQEYMCPRSSSAFSSLLGSAFLNESDRGTGTIMESLGQYISKVVCSSIQAAIIWMIWEFWLVDLVRC
jgi:hypothetical protein